MNPSTQAGRTLAIRDGIQPGALFIWNPDVNDWVVWTGSLGSATLTVTAATGSALASVAQDLTLRGAVTLLLAEVRLLRRAFCDWTGTSPREDATLRVPPTLQ